jgi:hypothetical protein
MFEYCKTVFPVVEGNDPAQGVAHMIRSQKNAKRKTKKEGLEENQTRGRTHAGLGSMDEHLQTHTLIGFHALRSWWEVNRTQLYH